MFQNFINKHDFLDVLRKGNESFSMLAKKITATEQQRVERTWAVTKYLENNWWDIPEVQYRWNKLISGRNNVEYYEYVSKKYFADKKNITGLSLGCGTGHRELKWAEQNAFRTIDAVDISAPRIDAARREASIKGFDKIITYTAADIYKFEMRDSYYDAIFVEQSLHHFTPLNALLKKIHSSLKPDGYLIVNEFVGPTRFQWTDRQITAINGILDILPIKYKKHSGSDNIKSSIHRPSKLRMILGDPSEAVESADIMPLIQEIFDVVETKAYGGTILNLLFAGIGHNFISSDSTTKHWLDIIFEVEDLLIQEGELQSDFVIAVCKKQSYERKT